MLTQAGNAKTETEKASSKERIQVEVLGSYDNNGKLVANNVRTNIEKNIPEAEISEGEFPLTVTLDGYTFTIDGDGNVTEFAEIKLSDKELILSIVDGNIPEYIITATKINLAEDIIWESSDTAVATVENGKVVAVNAGRTTITAKCISNEREYNANCEVEVAKHIDYSYVQYDVEYKDVYTGTEYTKNTGWRLLKQVNNGDGTYNIDIVSTGIPAKLYYFGYDDIKKFENTNPITKGKWAGDSTQRNTFVDKYYGTASNNNVYAAAGLLYNFENIVFNVTGTTSTLSSKEIGKEYGGYIEIKNGETTVIANDSTTGEDLFRSSIASGTIKEIRSVNLEDIKDITDASGMGKMSVSKETDKKTGLFLLQQYTPDIHTTSYYWLASPYGNGYERYLYYVGGTGGIDREDGWNGRTNRGTPCHFYIWGKNE